MRKWFNPENRKNFYFLFLITLMLLAGIGSPAASHAANPMVRLETTMGNITLELYPDEAPMTVSNFLFYVANGFYDGDDGNGATVFHRVMDGFVIQGGGFSPSFYSLLNPGNAQKNPLFPIPNEADNGLKNEKYTIAMARSGNPDSATSQFFINLADNEDLDFSAPTTQGWGYAVFGKVVAGMNVVDAIGSVPTTDTAYPPFENVPESPITVINAVIEGLENPAALNQSLYYSPAVAFGNWGTDVCVINGSDAEPLNGLLRAYFADGQPISGVVAVSLPPNGRKEIPVQDVFPNSQFISYFKFEAASDSAQGFSQIYGEGVYRAAVPAAREADHDTLSIPITISDEGWFTAVSLLNTGTEPRNVEVEVDGEVQGGLSLGAGRHVLFFMKDLLEEDMSTGIHSAVLRNATDIVGHVFTGTTGNSHYLSGFNLKAGKSEIYYPLLISTPDWWTGLAAHNPSPFACELRIAPFSSTGIALGTQTINLAGGETWLGMAQDLNLPANAAWLEVEANDAETGAEHDITGLELIGNANGNQMAGFSAIQTSATSGILPKLEQQGWSAFIFVNTVFSRAHVNLTAYDDQGETVATTEISIESRSQYPDFADAFFGTDISSATHVRYTSDKNVIAFQVDASADNMMLDGLGSLPLP